MTFQKAQNIASSIKLFVDDCILYKAIQTPDDTNKLHACRKICVPSGLATKVVGEIECIEMFCYECFAP